MKELVIRDGQERLNVPGTPVEILRGIALRFEIALDSEGRLVMTMFVKDHSPLMLVEGQVTKALQRLIRNDLTIEVKEA